MRGQGRDPDDRVVPTDKQQAARAFRYRSRSVFRQAASVNATCNLNAETCQAHPEFGTDVFVLCVARGHPPGKVLDLRTVSQAHLDEAAEQPPVATVFLNPHGQGSMADALYVLRQALRASEPPTAPEPGTPDGDTASAPELGTPGGNAEVAPLFDMMLVRTREEAETALCRSSGDASSRAKQLTLQTDAQVIEQHFSAPPEGQKISASQDTSTPTSQPAVSNPSNTPASADSVRVHGSPQGLPLPGALFS